MLLYYISDRTQFPGDQARRRERLLQKIGEAARAGVDLIQLREKDMCIRDLEELAREAVRVVRQAGTTTRLLINSRSDVAIAVGAHGVHLTSKDIPAGDARVIFAKAGVLNPVIGVSCHSVEEVRMAESQGADFAVFGPVFAKSGQAGVGVDELRTACSRMTAVANVEGPGARGMPVLALGGVDAQNARACLEAGAAGVAGIRLFQQDAVAGLVARLRVVL